MSLCSAALAVATLLTPGDSIIHPLDPLTPAEMAVVLQVLRAEGKLTRDLRFASLTLREPLKEAVVQQLASRGFRRGAEAIVYDWARSAGFRAQVDLSRARLIGWDSLPSREPPSRSLIRRRLEEIVRADPRWREALARRGLDPARVSLLPALAESQPLPWREADRVVRAVGFDQESSGSGALLRSLRLEVNLTRGTILEWSDSFTGGPVGPAPSSQAVPVPAGASPGGVPVRGSAIAWRNWRLHFGVHPRRGLELWDVAWVEGDRRRPILYRASVSEAMAAYGDPGFAEWYPRDAGNAGLGDYQSNSAIEGADAPPGATFADAVLADDFGRPAVQPRAVAIYERDGGLLWRHAGAARRARQLVVSSHATIDDYDFVFNWIFGEDGGIEVEVNLTGVMLLRREDTTAGHSPSRSSFGHRVAPGIVAPNHQHFFSFRLDFDVDGAEPNRVLELESERVPQGRRNPHGLWFAMRDNPLESEHDARRNLHTAASRKWKIVNPSRHNGLGDETGFTLLPGEVAIPYASARSTARRAAGFVGAQLWVTPYRRDEMYAAGEFVNFGWPDQGLPAWTRANRRLLDTDVVLWYTLGVTHIPRPEDFPVMPVHRASFRLLPTGFFSRNPSLP